jgi:NTE family protein
VAAPDGQGQPTRIAIACQGGGSHTAFTAGVLERLLRPDALAGREVVGLSGTSGGAVCALLAWSALAAGDPGRAGRLLEDFWADNSATTFAEQWVNAWVGWVGELADYVALPAVSPYDSPFSVAASDEFRHMLERRVDFGAIEADPGGRLPLLLVGAVDVRSGLFRTFDSRREAITADMILASAAIPTLFRSVPVDGQLYWDGLFSQNPPVKDLTDASPDELWVVQINPGRREAEPRSVVEIADRRNELAGNLSLHQELRFIEKIDQLLADGLLREGTYKQIVVRLIELDRPLSTASKLDRDPAFIRGLIEHGRTKAEKFLASLAFEEVWRRGDAEGVRARVAEGAAVDPSLLERLTEEVTVDLTRHQVAGDVVTWKVRGRGQDRGRKGRAEARFEDGQITELTLAPG